MKLFLKLLLILLWAAGCQKEHPVHLHPSPSYSLDPDMEYIEINLHELPDWHEFYSIELQPVLSLDVSEESQRISSVANIRLDDDFFYIVDDGMNIVHRLDYSGQSHPPLAAEGRGPGETVSPVNLWLAESEIVVMDRVNGLLYYDRESLSPKDPLFDGVRAVTIPPEDFCIIDDDFYILSAFHGVTTDQNEAVFKTESSFEDTKGFFHRYLYTDPNVVHMMTFGKLLCLPNRDLILYSAMFGAPILHMADLATDTTRAYLFSGLPPFYFDYTDRMEISERNYGSTYSRFRYQTVLDDRFLLHQYTLTDRPQDRDAVSSTQIVSIIFDLENDFKLYISRELGLIMESYNDMAVIHATEPELYEIVEFSIREIETISATSK
ncbi:MAG: 6-bladed beta-propeller [Balneolia bacterium]|nr:6-bladed beta-propeller [Balneolia bacterium]